MAKGCERRLAARLVMALKPIYKIHPAIGIARLGDASSFFIGPETPGLRPVGGAPGTAVPPYKDGGRIKPQAARFRIFEYVDNGKGAYVVGREVNMADKEVKVVWTVHLANRKASFFEFSGMSGEDRNQAKRRNVGFLGDRRKLEIDPGPRSVSGKSKGPVAFTKGTSKNPSSELWPNPAPSPAITTLGSILTDGDGRLLVLGGKGDSGSQPGASAIGDYANNDGWFDDVSDGPVTADVLIKGKAVTVLPAWVICPPPDFAPHLTSVVTLYDLLFDMATHLALPVNDAAYLAGGARANLAAISADFKKAGKPELSSYRPDFMGEVYPILYRAAASSFLTQQAYGHHQTLIQWAILADPSAAQQPSRSLVTTFVRPPGTAPTATSPAMPKLLGDEPYLLAGVPHPHIRLTVTPTQFAILKQWEAGKFVPPPPGSKFPPPAPPSTITPEGLDRAALESCVGGAFFPGIEVGWQIRNAALFLEPFRIKHGVATKYRGDSGAIKAGHFTRQMALPWQADFLQCKSEEAPKFNPFYGTGLWGWWPAQRPDFVFASQAAFRAATPTSVAWHRSTKGGTPQAWPLGFLTQAGTRDTSMPSYEEMLQNWRKFGFVVESVPYLYLETEREKDIP